MNDHDTDILADAIRAYAAIKLARQRSKEEIAAAVAALRDNNMAGLAECLIGSLPFDIEQVPDYERFLQ